MAEGIRLSLEVLLDIVTYGPYGAKQVTFAEVFIWLDNQEIYGKDLIALLKRVCRGKTEHVYLLYCCSYEEVIPQDYVKKAVHEVMEGGNNVIPWEDLRKQLAEKPTTL